MFAVILKDVHPPPYYILAKAFSSFFNYNVIGLVLLVIFESSLLLQSIFLQKSCSIRKLLYGQA